MNICTNEKEYINQIIDPVKRCCKRYGYLPSVLIAQSCLENGYGIPEYWDNPQIQTLLAVNNMVGIKKELLNKSWVDKGLSVWQGGYIRKSTPEQYGDQMVTIQDDFRIYDTAERSFADFLLFLTYASNNADGQPPKYGREVLDIKDPDRLIRTVAFRGYATGATYPNSVMRIVKKHNLTQYDDLTDVIPTDYVPNELTINQNWAFEPDHNTGIRTKRIKYIVVHYVGALGDAKANVEYYNQPSTRDASADFYVGHDGDIWQYNTDLTGCYCWAVGGGRQTQYGGALLGIANNPNSVSIEMCVKNTTGKTQAANSPTWYFTEQTVKATIKLVRYLMEKLNIPAERVIRHYDVNGKLCPGVEGWNDASGDDSAWVAFKAQISKISKESPAEIMPTPTISGTTYRVQVGAFEKKAGATRKANSVEKTSGYKCFTEQGDDGMYHVYCGSFEKKANAQKRADELIGMKIDAFVSEVAL